MPTLRRAEQLIKQLQEVRIFTPATGKYRRSPLYQADDILSLLAFGAERYLATSTTVEAFETAVVAGPGTCAPGPVPVGPRVRRGSRRNR